MLTAPGSWRAIGVWQWYWVRNLRIPLSGFVSHFCSPSCPLSIAWAPLALMGTVLIHHCPVHCGSPEAIRDVLRNLQPDLLLAPGGGMSLSHSLTSRGSHFCLNKVLPPGDLGSFIISPHLSSWRVTLPVLPTCLPTHMPSPFRFSPFLCT